jgi:thioredoxin-like negative regulator of GroEL
MIELLLAAERMLSVGLLDQAERLFNQVAEADPQNSIAVVGLARVTLERGDEAGAITLARRALHIDPENAAAQRMIERLEEVIRTRRGFEVPSTEATIAAELQPDPRRQPEPEPWHGPTTEPEPLHQSWLGRLLTFFRGR